jgi:hypothetical protein
VGFSNDEVGYSNNEIELMMKAIGATTKAARPIGMLLRNVIGESGGLSAGQLKPQRMLPNL